MAFIYKRMNWGSLSEPVTNTKLNDMIGNMDYLYENMITGYYNMFGLARTTGLSLRGGAVRLTYSENDIQAVNHYFPRPFSPGTRPVIVNGLNADLHFRIWGANRGLDGRAIPDHRGFLATFCQVRYPGGISQYNNEQWFTYIALGPGS